MATAIAIPAIPASINFDLDAFADVIAVKVAERLNIPIKSDEPRYYTRNEVKDILHVSIGTISRLTKCGKLKAKKVGARVLFDADMIDAAVRDNKVYKYKRG